MTQELEFHPYANIFPLIEGEAFDALVADIKSNGIREPIVLFEEKILDGRNRYRAARQAGVIDERGKAIDFNHHRPTVRRFMVSGIEGDPLAWVISANLHRRHLDDGQRTMVAAKLADMGHGGKRVAKAKPEEQAADRPVDPASAEPAGMTQAQAAQALNVSERNVRRAKAVIERGAPELVAAVEKGAVAVTLAEEVARLPKDEQTKLVRDLDPGVLFSAVKPVIDRQRKALVEQKKAKRAAKEQALGAKQRALPTKKFGVIYADPEWDFVTRSEAGKDRAAANHYPVSPFEVIKARPVQDIAATDCVLFLWVTVPHEELGHQVMKAWGFDYKSQMVWTKTGGAPGTGYWSRVDHEILLIGTRGKPPCPAPGTQSSSVIEAPVGEHSEKPEAFAELIERYFPSLPKIELNARKARPGWDVWGYEAPEESEPFAFARATRAAYGGEGKVGERELAVLLDRVNAGDVVFGDDRDGVTSSMVVRMASGIFDSPGRGSYYGAYAEGEAIDGISIYRKADVVEIAGYWDGGVTHAWSCMPRSKVEKFLRAWRKAPMAIGESGVDDIDSGQIPAFLRRRPSAQAEEGEAEPERCPDTADMLDGEGA